MRFRSYTDFPTTDSLTSMRSSSVTPLFLAVVVCALCESNSARAAPRVPPRNVLFIMADDLNNLIGCYGDPLAKTPNLDRLAARGMRFNNANCQFAICGPSRNSLLTGLYPNSAGVLRNRQLFRDVLPDHVSLPQAFRLRGYFAARIGKMYHYDVPDSIGTDGQDDPVSWELEMNPAGCDRLLEEDDIFTLVPKKFGAVLSWYASPRPDADHTDGMLASDAEWVLERCARQPERPFFLAVGFFRPHLPFDAPQKYFDMHPRNRMPVVTGYEEDLKDVPAAALNPWFLTEQQFPHDKRQACRQAYNAAISFMDAQVGRVIDALDRLGLAKNTIIVFTSDHGYHMGEHGQWQKFDLFEESVRVPLLIVAPEVTTPGSVCDSHVGLIDLYPTLAELCEVPAPGNLQGQSLVPMLKDPAHAGRGWNLCQVRRSDENGKDFYGYSLRTDRWRYNEWDENGRRGRELYDHVADPGEFQNLAEDSAHASVASEMRERLQTAIRNSFPADGNAPPQVRTSESPVLTPPE
jgi:arylsulfatase A-like enzyme